jgi:hypothetical protein
MATVRAGSKVVSGNGARSARGERSDAIVAEAQSL